MIQCKSCKTVNKPLFRDRPKGQIPDWYCADCLPKDAPSINPDVQKLSELIAKKPN